MVFQSFRLFLDVKQSGLKAAESVKAIVPLLVVAARVTIGSSDSHPHHSC